MGELGAGGGCLIVVVGIAVIALSLAGGSGGAAAIGMAIATAGLLMFVIAYGEQERESSLARTPEEKQATVRKAGRLSEEGKKIQAIKEVRNGLGLGLREAKEWVDAREENGWADVGFGNDLISTAPTEGAEPSETFGLTAEEWSALLREARSITEKGRKIQAIKLVRQRTGMGLREAKQWVDAREEEGWIELAFSGSVDSSISTDEVRPIPSNIRQAVLDRDDYICRYCGRRSQTMEVDHIIPVSQGGSSTLSNLVTSCRDCNRKKGGRRPEEAGMQVLPVRTRRRDRE